ncbi:hypothetical protein D3C79_1004360 [compost metagenome]
MKCAERMLATYSQINLRSSVDNYKWYVLIWVFFVDSMLARGDKVSSKELQYLRIRSN